MARTFSSRFKFAARLIGVVIFTAALTACRWTSGAPLLSKDQADWSPLKPGAYVHGDQTYEVEGAKAGPVVVTTHSSGDSDTYSVAFQKLGGKFFLVQAVSGSEINYLVIQTNKDGFIQYVPDCKDEDRAIATTSGAILAEDESCQFPNLDALRKAAKTAAAAIKAGQPGFSGDAFIRRQ